MPPSNFMRQMKFVQTGFAAPPAPMKTQSRIPALIAIVFAALSVVPAQAEESRRCVISQSGIAPVRLGMTLQEAKKAFPSATFRRTSDGDGAALVSVSLGKEEWMTLHAGEDDPQVPIDWAKRIRFIETFHSACKTMNGVHPGLPVADVEKRFGRTREIVQSEIESREYIRFWNQPARFVFRLNYSGIFAEGSRSTSRFSPDARIYSIAVIAE
jgi:hypothetical protein